jgi:hypothetical protein
MPADSIHLLRAPASTSRQTPRHGLHGWVEAICLARAALGKPLPLADAMGISATAFRAYFFSPDDNHAYRDDFPGVEWLEDTLELENYGVHEALSAHTASDIRLYDRLKREPLLQLVRHELTAGRPLLLTDPLTMLTWVVVGLGDLRLSLAPVACTEESFDPDDEHCLRLALSALRPTERPFTYRPDHFRRVALGWSGEHLNTKHELFHHLEIFVASGARALEVAAATCEREWGVGPGGNPAFASFFVAWVEELAWARALAVDYLRGWAAEASAQDEPMTTAAALAPVIEAARVTAEQTAAAIAALLSDDGAGCAKALREAAASERQTVAAVSAALA